MKEQKTKKVKVNDPPVPNRAHTEMKKDDPKPEAKKKNQKQS